MQIVDAESPEPALHGLAALAKGSVLGRRQLGPGAGVGEAREDLLRRRIAALPNHRLELRVETLVDREPPFFLPAVGRHQVDELHDARGIDRRVAAAVRQPRRPVLRNVDERDADLGAAERRIRGAERQHRAIQERLELGRGLDRAEVCACRLGMRRCGPRDDGNGQRTHQRRNSDGHPTNGRAHERRTIADNRHIRQPSLGFSGLGFPIETGPQQMEDA